MPTTQHIVIDLNTRGANPVAFTHQGDTARAFVFEVYNDGEAFTLTGYTAKIGAMLPADRGYYVIAGDDMATGTISGNTITVTLPAAYTAKSGNGVLTIILTGSGATIRPINVDFRIQKSADAADTVAGASDFPASLAQIVDDWITNNSSDTVTQWLEDALDVQSLEDVIDAWLDDHPEATTTVEDGSITTAKFQDGSVTTAKIENNAITEPKLSIDLAKKVNTPNDRYIESEFLYNAIPDNMWAQGFATDGTYGYICYFESNSSNAHLRKFNLSDGSLVSDVDMGIVAHVNNITIYNSEVYITLAGGSTNVLVYNTSLVLQRTMDIGVPIHSFGIVPTTNSAVGGFLALALQSETRKVLTVWVDNDANHNSVVQKRDLEYVNFAGARNGMHITGNSFLTISSYYEGSEESYPTVINMYDMMAQKMRSFILLGLTDEAEDLSVVDNDGYVSTAHGDVYSIDLSGGLLRNEISSNVFWDKLKINADWSATPYNIVQSNHIVTSFRLPVPHDASMRGMPYVEPSWSIAGYPTSNVKINPESGTTEVYGSVINGSVLTIVRLEYKATNYYDYTLNGGVAYQWDGTAWTKYTSLATTNPFSSNMSLKSPIVYLSAPNYSMCGETTSS